MTKEDVEFPSLQLLQLERVVSTADVAALTQDELALIAGGHMEGGIGSQ